MNRLSQLLIRLPAPALLCAVLLASGCKTSGKYVTNRGLDFIDQWRGAVGAGTVIGVRYKTMGVLDTGLLIGLKPRATAIGWRYGTPLWLHDDDPRMDANQAQILMTTTAVGLDIKDGSYRTAWNSFALLPAVFTMTDTTPTGYDWEVPAEGDAYEERHWLWSREAFADNRYAQIHIFDVEFEIALGVYLELGWSPGELIDFLLGIVTIDIAKDDRL